MGSCNNEKKRENASVGAVEIESAMRGSTADGAVEVEIARRNHAPGAPCGLLTNQAVYPLNIVGAPLFDWWVVDEDYDEVETAYQIRLYDDITGEMVWDSGRVDSSRQNSVPYSGGELKHGYPYSWEVRTWDAAYEVSPFSERARFATGLANADWGAMWIQGRREERPSPLAVGEIDGEYYIEARGEGVVLLDRGYGWTDYTLSLDMAVFEGEAGIVFRTYNSAYSGFMWSLLADGRMILSRGGSTQFSEVIALEDPGIRVGESYHLDIVLCGMELVTRLNGREVDRRTHRGNIGGTIAINTKEGSLARYSNILVTSSSGETLYKSELRSGSCDFGTGGALTDDNSYWYSRKEITLGGKAIARALYYIAGSQDYELSIDGVRVGRAETYDYLGETKYQGWDVTPQLMGKDRAAIGILTAYFDGGQGRAETLAGLIGRLIIYYTDGSTESVVTDSSWLTHSTEYSNLGPRNGEGDEIERVDARLTQQGFDTVGYDTAGWAPVVVHGAHPDSLFYNLEPEIGHVAEQTAVPIRVWTLDDGTTVADFGRVIPASIVIHFHGGVSGRELTIQEGYEILEDGSINTDRKSTQTTNMTYVYVMRDGEQTFRAWGFLGFRYVSVPPEGGRLTAEDFEATIFHAEVVEGRESTLVTSSEMLNGVFELLKRSAIYGVQNQFVDTPTREKGQFLVDAINISAATTSGHFERQASRKAILQFLDSSVRHWSSPDVLGMYNAVYPNIEGCRGIPDFSLNLPTLVRRYYMLTGDRELIKTAYPFMKNTADFVSRYTSPDTGLVTAIPGGGRHRSYSEGIVDSPAGRFGYDWKGTLGGARTTINALSVKVYDTVIYLAGELGFTDDVKYYNEKAARLRAAMNDRLLTEAGVYCDGLTEGGEMSPIMSQHATTHAIVADVPSADMLDPMADYVAGLGMRQGPMTAETLVEALFRTGRGEAALRLLTNTEDFGWAKLINEGYTFTWENWQAGSQSHGWGAAALWPIIEHISGVKILEPAAGHIRVAPTVGILESVESRTYTARGRVDISYSGRGADFTLTVTIPANMTAEIVLPTICDMTLVETSGGAFSLVCDGDLNRVRVGSGRRTFKYQRSNN